MAHVTAHADQRRQTSPTTLWQSGKMSGLVAQGRPPTGSIWSTMPAMPAMPLQICTKQYRPSSSSGFSRLKRTTQHLWKLKSEPGIAEKAIEIASEVLDTDLTEVIETVQTTATDAAVTTQAALQVIYMQEQVNF